MRTVAQGKRGLGWKRKRQLGTTAAARTGTHDTRRVEIHLLLRASSAPRNVYGGGWFEFGDSEVTEFTEAGWDWVGMIAQVANVAQGCRRSERHAQPPRGRPAFPPCALD